MQVWISFGLAVLASGIGVILLPGQELDRAFLAIGFFFCLFTSFSVAKTIRDNRDGQVDTSSWLMTVWVAFGAASDHDVGRVVANLPPLFVCQIREKR